VLNNLQRCQKFTCHCQLMPILGIAPIHLWLPCSLFYVWSFISEGYSATNKSQLNYKHFHYIQFWPVCISSVACKNWGTSVGIATGYRLDDQDSGVWFLAGTGYFSLLHYVQTSSGAHPASYPMGTRDSFPRGIAARAWGWPLSSF
jgi:hypothetical protein